MKPKLVYVRSGKRGDTTHNSRMLPKVNAADLDLG